MNLNEIILKTLSSASRKTLLNFVDGIFNENIRINRAIIDVQNRECDFLVFAGKNLVEHKLKGNRKINYYIIEAIKDEGINIASFKIMRQKTKEGFVTHMKLNKQCRVAFKEDLDNVDKVLDFGTGNFNEYKVPVINIFQYSLKELKIKKLYLLIPFQLLRLERALNESSYSVKEKTEKVFKLTHAFNNELKALANKVLIKKKDLKILTYMNEQLCSYVINNIKANN